ncbi:sodium:solute symporter [Glaciecola sp. MH2013]|uniref:sodium:solute symporter n=1 Tax=Glaciecola sp. MH2013 TaxID=2785524 RepID=UPI00189E25CB|nr:sodium:solute symporter [Glaciecola sp. MH2013]MBF7074012.1 sodium:solute symporter [Glaciecola sp. MH2013]
MIDQFSLIDWLIFAAYALILIVSGYIYNRRAATANDYFLGGKSMPMWVVAISVLATSQSAATFLGGPDQGYRGDLSYLATNIAGFIAAFFVAAFLMPKFYQHKVYTVYELLAQRFGDSAKYQAGLVYLMGRLFASGARLYMAAIAIAMILFGDIEASSVIISIILIATIGLLYTAYGGIKTVIYSDVIQCLVYVSAALLVLGYLLYSIPADLSSIIAALESPVDGSASKLTFINFSLDFSPSGVFGFWSIITGFVLLNIAAFGMDQDVTQRMLTCKDSKQATKALTSSIIMGIPVVLIFVIIGMLLYVYYQRPDLMSAAVANGEAPTPEFVGQTVTIFMYYVLTDLPNGIKAIVTIGIIAAALSTLNSGLNSMSSVAVQDIYRGLMQRKGKHLSEEQMVYAGRISMIIVALCLSAMAALCFYWQQHSDMPLLAFALSVMIFSYSGLLGVYFTALFSERGSPTSILFALIIGFLIPVLMQPYIMTIYLPEQYHFSLGFSWQLLIASTVATCICLLGNKRIPSDADSAKSTSSKKDASHA